MGFGEVEGNNSDKTATPECSEDRTAVLSVVKTESELELTQLVSSSHNLCLHSTHTFEGLQS